MSYRCAVLGCRSGRKDFKLFLGPYTDKTRWEAWKRACPFLENYSPLKLQNVRFCHKHFYPEHINKQNKLTPEAIPVLNLQFEGFTEYWQYLEKLVGSEPTSQLIDDDVQLYDSKPHHSHAVQDTFIERTNEVLEELKCSLCENIINTPKDEIKEGPEPKGEEDNTLSADFHPAKTTMQKLTVDECLDTGATESKEDVLPQKRPALSPFESLEKPTTCTIETTQGPTIETTQGPSAKENQILLQTMPHYKRKLYIPVPDRPKQTHVKSHVNTHVKTHVKTHVNTHVSTHVNTHVSTHVNTHVNTHVKTHVKTHVNTHVKTHVKTRIRPIILRRTPKDKSLSLIRSTQQGHSSENLVSTQILTEKRVLLPITQSNLIVKNSRTSIVPSNIIVQDNRTPMTPDNIIVQNNRTPITPSHVIVQDNRTPITPSRVIGQDNRTPITPTRVIVPR